MQKLIFVLLICTMSVSMHAQNGSVVLHVANVDIKKGGELAVAIFNRQNFLKMGKQISATSRDVTAANMSFVFDDLPAGEYAFVAFQDIDRSKTLKKNFIGYPIEPFGISNNPRMLFGPPSFNDAKLNVQPGKTLSLRIKLN